MHNIGSKEDKRRSLRQLFFSFTGLAALVWTMVRVIPKPARALYPCQRVALPLAASFVVWLLSPVILVATSVWNFKLARKHWKTKPAAASLFLLSAICFYCLIAYVGTKPNYAVDAPFIPEAANQPIGTGVGIHSGRVVWAHDPDATNRDQTGGWWEDVNTDPNVVDRMMSESICRLTGKSSNGDAWDAVFRYYNSTHGNGDTGYVSGDKISIKVNMNQSGSGEWKENTYNTSPQVIHALVRQLIGDAGVPGRDITIYDASRGIGDPVIEKIRNTPGGDYQDIRFVVTPRSMGPDRIAAVHETVHPVCFADTTMQDYNTTYLPVCVVESKYQINVGVLKGHNLAGVTLCAKNFLGSMYRPSNAGERTLGWTPSGTDEAMRGLHGYITPFYYEHWNLEARPQGSYNALVDLLGHEQLGGKVVLSIIDGLYSAKVQNAVREGRSIMKWQSAPFNNDYPSSIFMSQDVVALESVCVDFMRNEPEMEWIKGSLDNYLHEAALADDPPSGTFYDPEGDGTRLKSLGVHEHWNNATDRAYSRNLGTGDGIELVSINRE